jgi:hypothetical protein
MIPGPGQTGKGESDEQGYYPPSKNGDTRDPSFN